VIEPTTMVTVFTDFSCPFSYVTEAALQRIGAVRPLEMRPRAVELFPVPEPLPEPAHEEGELQAVASLAAELELRLELPPVRSRTRKAHEAARFAAERGAGPAMRMALYRAYWEEGHDIGRIDVLMSLIEALGEAPTDLKIALDIDRYSDAVAGDVALARRLRVARVPTLFLGSGPEARILQGARSLAALDEAISGG
jgi:predicted DsbA family dithiol-disulfide isomerase